MLATVALATLALQTSAQNQMRTLTLPPNRLNFAPAGSPPTLPFATTSQYRVANGAYDTNGNLLFYVKDKTVFRADGNTLGTLQHYTNGAASCGGQSATYDRIQKEIAIVPKQGTYNQYYVIWLGSNSCYSGFALRYATVTVGASPSMVENNSASPFYQDFITGNKHAGLAVSKKDGSGNRKLYVVTNLGYRMYNITSAGISAAVAQATWPVTYPTGIYPSDVEISPNNDKIAWGSVESNYVVAALLDANRAITTTSVIPEQTQNAFSTLGVEFAVNGDLYYSAKSLSTNLLDGIYKIPFGSVPGSMNANKVHVNTNTTITNSHIELGYDGFLYMVNTSGKLVQYNMVNNTPATPSWFATQTITSNDPVYTDTHYSLPDQIDGEDYTLFRGMGALAYPAPIVRSSGTVMNPVNGIYDVYNCNTFTLQPTTTNYTNYTLSVFASNASGTVGTQLYTSGTVSGTYPNAQDIAGLGATNIRNTPGGFYVVRLRFGNGFDTDQSRDFRVLSQNFFSYTALGVNNTTVVTPTNGSYKVFTCKPITLTPTTAIQTQYKLSLETANAAGQRITGTGTLQHVPTTFTTGAYPTTADLRTWPGTNNHIQNMTTAGYILATLELKDNCNAPLTKTALFWINSLDTNSANYSFNLGDGSSPNILANTTSLASPAQMGSQSLQLVPGVPTGFIESFSIKIEKVNQSTGAVVQVICNNPTTVLSNNTLPGFVGLSGYTSSKCGQVPGFYLQPANQNQVYKVSFLVSNACGTGIARIGFFQNSDANWRKGDVEENINTQETLVTQGHAMYPNPSTGKATLQYLLENETNVSLSITDAQGNKVATVLDNVTKSVGAYSQAMDLTNFPDGIYYYRLNTNKAIVGKIVKSSK